MKQQHALMTTTTSSRTSTPLSPFKMRSLVALLLLFCLLLSSGVHAGKQRDEEDEDDDDEEVEQSAGPTSSPTVMPTVFPTAAPSLPDSTTVIAPPPTTTTATTVASPPVNGNDTVVSDNNNNTYTLDVPELSLFFVVPIDTNLDLTTLEDGWQSMLTNAIQVAASVQVQEWSHWEVDTTYAQTSGQGLLRANGQITVSRNTNNNNRRRRRRLQTTTTATTTVDVSQEDFEGDLYDYFLVWGVDDTWEYLVARGYPVTALSLQMTEDTFTPRGKEPAELQSLLGKNNNGDSGDGNDDSNKRNAWIAGVVMVIVVVSAMVAVTLLYLQRRGRRTTKKELQYSSSPRTAAASDPASPHLPLVDNMSDPDRRRSPLDGSFGPELGITGAMSGEGASSVPGFSDCSFLYDASRLDSVISSAKDYELPYDVPRNVFSDLTMEGRDAALAAAAANNEEEEEDDIMEKGLVSDLDLDDESKDEPKEDTRDDPKNLSALLNSSDDTSDAFSEIVQFQKQISEPKANADPETPVDHEQQKNPDVSIVPDAKKGLYSHSMLDEEKKVDEGDESIF